MPNVVNLAIGQLRPSKGPHTRNMDRLGQVMAQALAMQPVTQVLHLPECALTGYFVQGAVRELAIPATQLAQELQTLFLSRAPTDARLDLVLGFYERFQSTLYNSAMYVTLGGGAPVVRHIHRKLFLPTYALFDEERFVERGHEIRAFDTSWGRCALLVCEDAWHSVVPTAAALDGAEVIFLSAAAPSRGLWPRDDDTPGPYTLNRWERLARDIAEEHGVFVSLAHMVGSEGGKIFAGGSALAGPRGNIIARAPIYEEALLAVPVHREEIVHARADMPLLSDLRTMLPFILPALDPMRPPPLTTPPAELPPPPPRGGTHPHQSATSARTAPTATPLLVVRGEGAASQRSLPPLAIDAKRTEAHLVTFLRDEFARRNYQKAVVGISGGVDSAVSAYLAVRALGAENVIGVRLPYRTSSAASLEHAQRIIDELGIAPRTVDISDAVDGYLKHDPGADATRRGNVMARVRMIVLFDLSARYHALPIGTGNKTERLLGYFTWHADDTPPVNPIGDLYKTQVWELASFLGIPDEIISKAPTADLVAGQTDEGDLGVSYAAADRILNSLLSGCSPDDIIGAGASEADVNTVVTRLGATHWKRQLPTVAMVSGSAIGESYLRPVDY